MVLRWLLLATSAASRSKPAPWATRCPRVAWRTTPSYPIWAQVHRNRLGGLSLAPAVAAALRVVCVIGEVAGPDGAYSAARVVEDALLRRSLTLRDAAALARAGGAKVVLYHNPRHEPARRGLVPALRRRREARAPRARRRHARLVRGRDARGAAGAAEIRVRARRARARGNRDGRRRLDDPCPVAASDPAALDREASFCDRSAERRGVLRRRSLVAVDGEVATVVSTRSGPNGTCVLALRRDGAAPTGGRRAARGAAVLAPAFLDGGVLDGGRDCLYAPPQYAFDYASPAAAACVAAYASRDQALGLDGTWYDNLGANVYGACDAAGAALHTAELRPAFRARAACGERARRARLAAARAAAGNGTALYANGLKHSYYWRAAQIGELSAAYLKDRCPRRRGDGCAFETTRPPADFWRANVRVAAHAAARRYGVLVKVGQAGWKTVAQEHQRDGDSHGWALAYWASFLLAVRDPSGPLALGVHPFHRGTTGNVAPWLHPVLFLDVRAPRETRDLLEAYRVPDHFTYRRVFDRGVALYNPSDLVDLDVPLGGAYVDPWDARCGAADR
ncbi:hypothetical protein JL721_6822 [Aureococcus anophagefferens]|nr:hypothetical protein JL721_6822 [Aureococcus anophagefferens]